MFTKAVPVFPEYGMLTTLFFNECKLRFTATNMGSWGFIKRGKVALQLQLIADKQLLKTISCCIYTNSIKNYYADLILKGVVSFGGRL